MALLNDMALQIDQMKAQLDRSLEQASSKFKKQKDEKWLQDLLDFQQTYWHTRHQLNISVVKQRKVTANQPINQSINQPNDR
jgi:Skp family chaperone for outer membrane proteins